MRASVQLPVILLALSACRAAAPSAAGPNDLPIADTVAQPSDGHLASPLRLTVAPTGELFVVDPGTSQVVVLDSLGHETRRFGGAGAGPGELTRPTSISVSTDTVWVADGGKDEVEVYTTAGRFVRAISGLPWLGVAEIAFNEHGAALLAQHGRDTTLARRVSADGRLGSKLGRPSALPDLMVDFRRAKQDLAAGTIPPSFLNFSAPAIGADGSAWVLGIVAGKVQRYSPTDSILWTATLPDSITERLRRAIADSTSRDTTPTGFAFPSVIQGAIPVGDTLWLLLQTASQRTTIGRLTGTGQWLPWLYVGPTGHITAFAIDPRRHRLYLLDRGEGTIVRVALPAT
jgi:hypothetical protein